MPSILTESDARKLAEKLRQEEIVTARKIFGDSVETVSIELFMRWKSMKEKLGQQNLFNRSLFGDTIHDDDFVFSLQLKGTIDTGDIAVVIDHTNGKYRMMSEGP